MQSENCHFAHTNHQRLPGYNFEIGDCKGSGLDGPQGDALAGDLNIFFFFKLR